MDWRLHGIKKRQYFIVPFHLHTPPPARLLILMVIAGFMTKNPAEV